MYTHTCEGDGEIQDAFFKHIQTYTYSKEGEEEEKMKKKMMMKKTNKK